MKPLPSDCNTLCFEFQKIFCYKNLKKPPFLNHKGNIWKPDETLLSGFEGLTLWWPLQSVWPVFSPSVTLQSLREIKVNNLTGFSPSHFISAQRSNLLWLPVFMHLLRWLSGFVREKGRFIFFLSPFFFCAISCLQKPLMPIQHQHQGTALMSILATDSFLSLLPAALSLSPSFPTNPLYPFHFPLLTLYAYCTIK